MWEKKTSEWSVQPWHCWQIRQAWIPLSSCMVKYPCRNCWILIRAHGTIQRGERQPTGGRTLIKEGRRPAGDRLPKIDSGGDVCWCLLMVEYGWIWLNHCNPMLGSPTWYGPAGGYPPKDISWTSPMISPVFLVFISFHFGIQRTIWQHPPLRSLPCNLGLRWELKREPGMF